MTTANYDVYAGVVAIVNRSAIRLIGQAQGLGQWLMLEKTVTPPVAGDEIMCRAHRGTFSIYQLDILERGRDRIKREQANRQALASKQAEGEDVIQRGAAAQDAPLVAKHEEEGHAVQVAEATGVGVRDGSEVCADVGQENELHEVASVRTRQPQHKPRARKALPSQDPQPPLGDAQ